jgi:hypothetical protein
MGFGFRKSFKLAPGLKVNLSKRGAGVSLGGKGLTHSIGTSGRRTTVSAPGTGLSYTARHGSGGSQSSRGGSALSTIILLIGLVALLVWLFT